MSATKTISARLPIRLWRELKTAAKRRGLFLTAALEQAIRRWVLEQKEDGPNED